MAIIPTNTTLLHGFLEAPSVAKGFGRSDPRLIAKVTRETPSRSDSPSLNVVRSAPAATIATPTELPTTIIVSVNGELEPESRAAPSTDRAVKATRMYRRVAVPSAITVARG